MPDEPNKKSQYLKREEVRTMEKDIARLREQESETAREKIARLRTEEEAAREAEKSEQLRVASEEREKIEEGTRKQEEELKKAKLERKTAAVESESAVAAKKGQERDELRNRLKKAQSHEEEARRKFLEKIEAKAEGGTEGRGWPTPPPLPAVPPVPPRTQSTPSAPPISPLGESSSPAIPSIPSVPLIHPISPLDESLEEHPEEAAPEPIIPVPAAPHEEPAIPPVPPAPAPTVPPAPPKKSFKLPKFTLPSFGIPKPKLPPLSSLKVPLPKIPSIPMPKVKGYFPQKPSILEKIWIRVVISIFVVAILATVATFWYWYLMIRPAVPAATEAPATEAPAMPAEKPKPAELFINEKILQFGYHIPSESRIIDTIIIHSVYNALGEDGHNIEGVIKEYEIYKVAAHYLIDRDGKIYQTAPREAIAYHAGVSQMPDGRTNVNDFSVGIELIYTKEESPTETQYESLKQLVNYLQKEYSIPAENILGHKVIAPGRKDDPWNFDLNKLKSLIFSLVAPSPSASPSTALGAEFILNGLTLDKKIGQLFIIGFEGTVITPELENFIKTARPGGILLFKKNIAGPSQIKELLTI